MLLIFISDPGVRKFILHRLTRKALLKRVKNAEYSIWGARNTGHVQSPHHALCRNINANRLNLTEIKYMQFESQKQNMLFPWIWLC